MRQPPTHARWTDDEDRLLLSCSTYDEYRQRGGTRTRHSCTERRYRLRSDGHTVPAWPKGGAASYGRRTDPPAPEPDPEPAEEPIGFRARAEDEDVRDYWEAQKRAIAAHQRRLGRASNRVIPYETETPDQPFGILFFGDTHIGSSGVLVDRLEYELDLMRQACETLGTRLVCMGDVVENAKIHGKAAPATYDQAFGPSPQIEVAEMLLQPLGPYFLAFLEGNHDSRDATLGGVGWLQGFARRLGAPYVSEAGCAIHLTHGFCRYTVYAKHDWRGKSQINKSNSLRRFWVEYPEWENADVGVLAHLHEPLYESVQQKGRRVHWIRTGSLKVHDSYAERGGYTPEPGTAVVMFWPDRRHIEVDLDLERGLERLEDAQRRYRQGE